MREIRLAVCVIHAKHLPERAPLMRRLRARLEVAGNWAEDEFGIAKGMIIDPRGIAAYHEETTRGHNFAWHELALRWLREQRMERGATHGLTIQDDTIPCGRFWEKLMALIRGRPDQVICLDCAHPAARQIFAEGHPGYTTPDQMIGIGHVEPIEVIEDFYEWRTKETRPGTFARITEDSLFALYCMHRQRPIFSPVPCLLDHDLSIASTGPIEYDQWYRKPQVTERELERVSDEKRAEIEGNMLDPEWWAREAPHIGRFYESAQELLPVILPGDVHELVAKYALDRTPKRYERFWTRITPVGS